MTNKPEVMLWLSDARGQYIPQDFASSFADRDKSVTGVAQEDWDVLDEGPEHEWYWEAWNDVESSAIVTDDKGHQYFVYQNGDCWLVPVEMQWNDEKECFEYPSETVDE